MEAWLVLNWKRHQQIQIINDWELSIASIVSALLIKHMEYSSWSDSVRSKITSNNSQPDLLLSRTIHRKTKLQIGQTMIRSYSSYLWAKLHWWCVLDFRQNVGNKFIRLNIFSCFKVQQRGIHTKLMFYMGWPMVSSISLPDFQFNPKT